MAQITVTEDVRGNPLPFPLQIHEDVKPNLDTIWKYATNDWDGLIIFFGKSGVGKSLLAKCFGLYFNADFSNKNVVYNVKEFEKFVDTCDKQSVVLFDEADFATDRSNREVMYAIKRKLKRIREKNLIILFSTPTIKDMDWYFVDRAILGIRCRAYGYNDRGHYDCYVNTDSDGRFEMLLELMKRSATQRSAFLKIAPSIPKAYNRHPKNYVNDWESVWPMDEEELSNRKAKDTADNPNKRRKSTTQIKKEVGVEYAKSFMKWYEENHSEPPRHRDIADALGVDRSTISNYFREEGKV